MNKNFTFIRTHFGLPGRILSLLFFALAALRPTPVAGQSCPPLSTLPCDKVQVSLPYSLNFTSGVPGTIPDRNGAGTGFTMVDTYSGTRHSQDGTPSNPAVPGYERSKLTLVSGRLQVVTNKGIASIASNNQLNTLAVKVDARGRLTLQVTVINPYYGTGYQQGGLWFGLNDKNFVKLVAVGNQVELLREVNDGSTLNRLTPVISGLNTKTVRLRLVVDPAANTAQGFYSTDGTNYLSVGSALSLAGTGLTGATAHAGLYATHRHGTTPITYTFDDFSVTGTTVTTTPSGNGYLVVENADKFPGDDRMTFSLIQIPWRRRNDDGTYTPYNQNHNRVKLKISNKGSGTLDISSLSLSNPAAWKIVSLNGVAYNAGTSLPVRLDSRASVEALIEFIAKDQGTRVRILNDKLYIASNDAASPNKEVKLHGLWQYKGEGGNEPYVQEIIRAFGFLTRTGFGASDGVNDGTTLVANSDEILSAFFVRADPTKPVSVIQMAAYHGCCDFTERFQWYYKGSGTVSTLFTHNALDGQSLLPRKYGSTTALAQGTFSPSGAFAFKVGSAYSDRDRNYQRRIGMRMWKAIDANGNTIPNAYIIGGDYLGTSYTNYDYQDNVFLVSNVRPETGAVHYAELGASPSAINFGSLGVGAGKTLSVSLKNLGKTYADGSKDPSLTIQRIELVGGNEFTAAMPTTTTLSPQAGTTVNVRFSPTSRGLKNAALLVYYTNALSPLRVPLYGIANSSGSTIVVAKRIKGGSDANMTIGGNAWEADINYRRGLVKLDRPQAAPVAGTDVDALYQTYLSSTGDFNVISYEVPVPNGSYLVRLHFAEMYWNAVGSRVFGISLENGLRLSNFDMFREVGPRAALVKDYEVNVTDGVLSLKFTPTADRLSLAGIELFKTTATTARVAAELPEEAPVQASLQVYPNPVSGGKVQVALQGFGQAEKVGITLYNLSGQAVQSADVVTDADGGGNAEIGLGQSLNRGMYLIQARGATGRAQARLVVE